MILHGRLFHLQIPVLLAPIALLDRAAAYHPRVHGHLQRKNPPRVDGPIQYLLIHQRRRPIVVTKLAIVHVVGLLREDNLRRAKGESPKFKIILLPREEVDHVLGGSRLRDRRWRRLILAVAGTKAVEDLPVELALKVERDRQVGHVRRVQRVDLLQPARGGPTVVPLQHLETEGHGRPAGHQSRHPDQGQLVEQEVQDLPRQPLGLGGKCAMSQFQALIASVPVCPSAAVTQVDQSQARTIMQACAQSTQISEET